MEENRGGDQSQVALNHKCDLEMNGNLIGLKSHNSDKICWAIFDRH